MLFRVVVLFSLIFIASCGGGGDSSSSDSSNVPVTPPQPVSSKILIDSNNFELINAYAWSVPSSMLQLYQYTLMQMKEFSTGNPTMSAVACGVSGNVQISAPSQLFELTQGEQFIVKFEACESLYIGGMIDGELSMVVDRYQVDKIVTEVTNNVVISTKGGEVSLGGNVLLDYFNDGSIEHLNLKGDADDVTFAFSGLSETLSEFSIDKSFNANSKSYQIDYDFIYFSEVLDGEFYCKTKNSMTGIILDEPDDFLIECNGSESSVMNSWPFDKGVIGLSGSDAWLSYRNNDAFHDGVAFIMHEVAETGMFSELIENFPELKYSSKLMSVFDMTVEKILIDQNAQLGYLVGQFYNLESPEGGRDEGVIEVVDLVNMKSLSVNFFEHTFNSIELSKDGSNLLVTEDELYGRERSKVVKVYSTSDFQLLSEIDVLLHVQHLCENCRTSEFNVESIYFENDEGTQFYIVSSFDTNHVVGLFNKNGLLASGEIMTNNSTYSFPIDIIAIDENTVLTLSLEFMGQRWIFNRYQRIENNLVFESSAPATESIPGYTPQFVGTIGEEVLTNGEVVYSSSDLLAKWSIPYGDHAAVNQGFGRIYQRSRATEISSYRLGSGDKIGSYKIDSNIADISNLKYEYADAGYMVFTGDGKLSRVGVSILP